MVVGYHHFCKHPNGKNIRNGYRPSPDQFHRHGTSDRHVPPHRTELKRSCLPNPSNNRRKGPRGVGMSREVRNGWREPPKWWMGLGRGKSLYKKMAMLGIYVRFLKCKWFVDRLIHLLINGVHWGYNPCTNHLLTSSDIQEGHEWTTFTKTRPETFHYWG